MRIKKPKLKNSGFTLLETLASISVLSLAITGPLALASFTIRSAGLSQNQFTAFYLAQEAMEYVKNLRDNNAFLEKANWLDKLAPSGPGNGLCRNPKGCYIDITDGGIQPCSPSSCPKMKYDSATGLYNYSSGPETSFIREVRLDYVSDYEEKISITVFWQERLILRSFVLEENIFNWP